MWLLSAFFLAAVFFCGSAQDLQQSPISITRSEGKTVLINCHVSSSDFSNIFIHWYRKRANAAPERVAYMSSRIFLENQSDEGKFSIEKDFSKSICTLTVSKITLQDSATYYCARWDAQQGYYNKVFGSGTKLVVSDKGSSPPANSEILQKKHENQIMYVCLIEKFYPEVIRVTWTDEEKEITENVVKGDAWQPTEEDEYSIATWLTVPADNKDKKYYCKYEHESQKNSLPSQVNSTKNAPQEGDCSAIFNRDVTFPDVTLPDHLMHRTAYLVYIILLLKSNMYYLIILFFIYRMRTPTKHQGKKV
ncbi:TCR gamma alternate reading frame protein [Manacus candei]|uniref:TCR gamma alternate reading frame protein n=1 Tax=Manacus candei TaxID=415023 RepID=UPI00222754D4|nr:TCR gamma alternate reading frame protein [Manacus candei]